jgi:pimeloyl-ACP methyl ester carboxylesterase
MIIVRKLALLTVSLLLLGAAAAGAQDSKTFVLVDGAFQDEAGWESVIAALESAGHTAVTVDLGSNDEDGAPIPTSTLAGYRDAVVSAIEEQEGSVVLVGHSFGGMIISEAAEAIPDRIETLVYLAAYLPRTGESLVTLSSQDHYSALGQEGNLILAEDFTYASVNSDIFASAFCPDCTEEQAALVADSQLDEPLAPLNEPVTLTDENFGSVRKAYILTAEDIIISPQLQALMLSYTPVDRVLALNTGHAPYISQPEALAALLIEAAS